MNIGLFCLKSCMKSGDNKEYYELLELPTKRPSPEDIKRAYKKASLNYHPDKLAQKGIEVTPEHRQRFVKIKEAYEVLSDPKRKKVYDQLGATGLKLTENPQSITPQELLKNFQANRGNRCVIFLIVGFIFAALLLLPILFSLKCDGTLGRNVSWLGIWTPAWIFDALILYASIMLFFDSPDDDEDDEDNGPNGPTSGLNSDTNTDGNTRKKKKPEDDIPIHQKIFAFTQTIAIILLQIFILAKLDRKINWNWFEVFSAWFIYEGLKIISSFYTAFIEIIPMPLSDAESDIENSETGLEEDLLFKQYESEMNYLEKCIEQKKLQMDIFISLLCIWQAIFLAIQLNGDVRYNWGLIFLPIWLYLLIKYSSVFYYRTWSRNIIKNLTINTPEDMESPKIQIKVQQANRLSSMASMTCILQLAPLLSSILLVSRLESRVFSTFLIIIPIFLVLGCCCCLVCGVIIAASTVDVDAMEREMHAQQSGQQSTPPAASDADIFKDATNEADMVRAIFVPVPPPTAATGVANEKSTQQPNTSSMNESIGSTKNPVIINETPGASTAVYVPPPSLSSKEYGTFDPNAVNTTTSTNTTNTSVGASVKQSSVKEEENKTNTNDTSATAGGQNQIQAEFNDID